MDLLELGYGLFFGVLSFLDFKGGGCWLRLLALLEDESDEEFLRFARRFIQLEKGLRRECLSRLEVSIRLGGYRKSALGGHTMRPLCWRYLRHVVASWAVRVCSD